MHFIVLDFVNVTQSTAAIAQHRTLLSVHNFIKFSVKYTKNCCGCQFIPIMTVYDRGRSFFSLYSASSETLATFTTLKRTPGMSPTA